MPLDDKKTNRYAAIIESIFFSKYKPGDTEVPFKRDDLLEAARKLKLVLPRNIGDAIYSIRYRAPMPERILSTQPPGKEWTIEGQGRALYRFRLDDINRIVPNRRLTAIKLPDATPEIVSAYALSDEQALLAKVRYNRLLDIFLGIATYSLQNHLRTTVQDIGQVEIDELYVGVDKRGCQFVLPVQAKGGRDQLSAIQAKQDIACCREKFPGLVCRPISAQFITDNLIALFELTQEGHEIKIAEERHYCLVPAEQISKDELAQYALRTP